MKETLNLKSTFLQTLLVKYFTNLHFYNDYRLYEIGCTVEKGKASTEVT